MKSVMVVDDDDDIRETISGLLAQRGFQVTTAADGNDALQQLRSGDLPGLILLDLMMPSMSGEEFRAWQMNDPRLAAVPVVVLSGAGMVDEVGKKMKVEAISKPIELTILVDTVKRYCGAAE
jgi:CheY-like chemotaxis protein